MWRSWFFISSISLFLSYFQSVIIIFLNITWLFDVLLFRDIIEVSLCNVSFRKRKKWAQKRRKVFYIKRKQQSSSEVWLHLWTVYFSFILGLFSLYSNVMLERLIREHKVRCLKDHLWVRAFPTFWDYW